MQVLSFLPVLKYLTKFPHYKPGTEIHGSSPFFFFFDMIMLIDLYIYAYMSTCVHIRAVKYTSELQKGERWNINIPLAAGFTHSVCKEIWLWVPEHIERKT